MLPRLPMLWGVLLLLAACSLVAPRFIKPEVSVASVEFTGGNLLQQNFLVKLNIQNPNDRALPVTGLHVEVAVAGERLASGVSNRAFVVPPLGETSFDMTVTANAALALLKIGQHRGGAAEPIAYDLTGAANLDLPFLHEVPFGQHGTLDLSR